MEQTVTRRCGQRVLWGSHECFQASYKKSWFSSCSWERVIDCARERWCFVVTSSFHFEHATSLWAMRLAAICTAVIMTDAFFSELFPCLFLPNQSSPIRRLRKREEVEHICPLNSSLSSSLSLRSHPPSQNRPPPASAHLSFPRHPSPHTRPCRKTSPPPTRP